MASGTDAHGPHPPEISRGPAEDETTLEQCDRFYRERLRPRCVSSGLSSASRRRGLRARGSSAASADAQGMEVGGFTGWDAEQPEVDVRAVLIGGLQVPGRELIGDRWR